MGKINVTITWNPDNFGAASDVLPVVATGNTVEDVKINYKSALKFHLEGLKEDRDEIPEELQGKYELEFVLNAQALLKHVESILTRSALARITGINEKQLGHYFTGYRTPRESTKEKIIIGLRKIRDEFDTVV